MEIRKTIRPVSSNGKPMGDRFEPAECECVLALPDGYTDDGEGWYVCKECTKFE